MELAVVPSKKTLLLRSLAYIVLGAIMLIWPAVTILVVVFAFAINILIVGLATLFEPAFDKSNKSAILTVILGLLAVVVGIYLLVNPVVTVGLIDLLVAIWALVFGLADLYLGFTGNTNGGSRLLFILVGVVSLIFGIYMLNNPVSGLGDIVMVLGIYSLVVGIMVGSIGLFFYPKSK
jgi:uncharacterized membrane protein HdeD (DUF308 family)